MRNSGDVTALPNFGMPRRKESSGHMPKPKMEIWDRPFTAPDPGLINGMSGEHVVDEAMKRRLAQQVRVGAVSLLRCFWFC